jgi:hypothetical protein
VKRAILMRAKMVKHRCVDSTYFEASRVRKAYVDLLVAKGLSIAQANLFLRAHRAYLFISDSVNESIGRNIAWCFDRHSFFPQRYNTDFFGAYYTAKEVETSEKEFEFHYRKAMPTSAVTYTVFSVEVTGNMADLRSVSELNAAIIDPIDYTLCQGLADRLRAYCDGLAVPSIRHRTGNCCPIFSRATLTPGELIKEGDLTP